MAPAKMYMIVSGPSLMELQFSDYHLPGHTVEFRVEETSGAEVSGEIFRVGGRSTLGGCQVTGSDRVESIIKDELGRQIPGTARLIRIRCGDGFRFFRGWYNPTSPRDGLLIEVPHKHRRKK